MTRDEWLKAHAYLQPVATLDAEVEAAAEGLDTNVAPLPGWEEYVEDFRSGVPLLVSPAAGIDLEPAGRAVASIVKTLAARRLPGNLAEDARGLQAELEREIRAPRRLADWLLGDDGFAPTSPGLLRYLGWKAAARALRPLVGAFGGWREEERWMRNYCPTCGSKPAMAQLLGTDPGRKRFLSCGCCRTRWQYGRTRCPFCEQDSHRLGVVAVAKEGGLRIDYCESCRGYLKTLEGQADEELLLSDWSSLHLDLVAHDRGLKRLAVSLYDLEPILQT
jgi:FdhE protein